MCWYVEKPKRVIVRALLADSPTGEGYFVACTNADSIYTDEYRAG